VRAVLVEAAWVASRSTGPLRAFWERTARPRGADIATIAVARELVVLAWHLLTKREDYAFQASRRAGREAARPRVAHRRRAPAEDGARVRVSPERRRLDKELAAQAEIPYRRLIADWHATAGRRVRPRHRGAHLVNDQQRNALQAVELVLHLAVAWGVGQHGNPFGGCGTRRSGGPGRRGSRWRSPNRSNVTRSAPAAPDR